MQDGHRGLIEQEYHHNVYDTIPEGTPNICHDTDLVRRNTTTLYPHIEEVETKYFFDADSPPKPHKYFDLPALWGTARSMRFPLVTFYTLCKDFFVTSHLTSVKSGSPTSF